MAQTSGAPPGGPVLALIALLAACQPAGDQGIDLPGAAGEAFSDGDPCEKEGALDKMRCALGRLKSAPELGSACSDSEKVPVYAHGSRLAEVCSATAERAGFTLIDLGDAWAPRVLRGSAERPLDDHERYAKLANEQLGDDELWDRARHDRYFELYGIFPSLSVVASRLADEKRHACHDAIDDTALDELGEAIDTWKPLEKQRAEKGRRNQLALLLKQAVKDKQLASIHQLAEHRAYRSHYQVWRRLDTRIRAIAEMQEHLRCEGLLDRAEAGIMDRATIEGMQAYHRRHMIVAWQLDDETRRTLLTDTRELDFRTLLRSLRERVVDATGLIEDGTASGHPTPVVDRVLDAAAFLKSPIRAGEGGALDNAAPDLIGAATDVAARALGWISPAAAQAFLQAETRPARVAVKLPEPPAYHGEHMTLRMVIDRGDVWFDFPFAKNGDRYLQPVERRPSVVLYAEHEGKDIPLVRWPTTIGGWQPEQMDEDMQRLLRLRAERSQSARKGKGKGKGKGKKKRDFTVALAYKESPAGPRIVRDIVAAPRWIPPESAPPRDLVRPRGEGRWAVRYDTFGPGYASAYGLVMLIHHRVDGRLRSKTGDQLKLTDQGIRTHGSVSYDSIHDGFSHGCHRLHNHRAVRLSSFLLAHRRHEVRGDIPLGYARTFEFRGQTQRMEFDSRGYRYELTPPIEVDVLPGRIMGTAKAPLPPRELTERMQERYRDPEP